MKRGFTLIELMVYIAIASIVVLIAGRVYVDSVDFRIGTKNKLEVAENASNLMTYVDEDLRRLGARTSQIEASSSSAAVTTNSLAYWDPITTLDSSSFAHTNNGEKDQLAFRSAEYNTDGTIARVIQVSYHLDSDNHLIRTMSDLSAGTSSTSSLIMANNIVAFNVEPGIYTTTSTGGGIVEISPDDAAPTSWGLAQRLGTTATVAADGNDYMISGVLSSTNPEELVLQAPLGTVKAFPITHGKTYTVSFTLKSNDAFRKYFNKTNDTLSACIRKTDAQTSPHYLQCYHFYAGPVEADGKTRSFDFSSDDPLITSVALVYRFHFASTLTSQSPTFSIGHIAMQEKTGAIFDFKQSVTTLQKNDVKALRITIRSNVHGEEQTVTRIIQIPNNGV